MRDTCVLNAALGYWYPKGQERLYKSLLEHNQLINVDFVGFKEWMNDNYNKDCPYNIKACSLEKAIQMGYKKIIWADCSMYAIRTLKPIWDYISENGFYCPKNGFNVCEETSDACLKYFNITRDDAEKMEQCSSGLIGFDIEHPKGKEFAELWIKAAKDGVFSGSRLHDNQSTDPRFKYHRQDQSVASLIIYKLGIQNCMETLGNFVDYETDKEPNKNTIFLCKGL